MQSVLTMLLSAMPPGPLLPCTGAPRHEFLSGNFNKSVHLSVMSASIFVVLLFLLVPLFPFLHLYLYCFLSSFLPLICCPPLSLSLSFFLFFYPSFALYFPFSLSLPICHSLPHTLPPSIRLWLTPSFSPPLCIFRSLTPFLPFFTYYSLFLTLPYLSLALFLIFLFL